MAAMGRLPVVGSQHSHRLLTVSPSKKLQSLLSALYNVLMLIFYNISNGTCISNLWFTIGLYFNLLDNRMVPQNSFILSFLCKYFNPTMLQHWFRCHKFCPEMLFLLLPFTVCEDYGGSPMSIYGYNLDSYPTFMFNVVKSC